MSELKDNFEEIIQTVRSITGVSQADFDVLKGVASHGAAWKGELVTAFYDLLYAVPKTQALFNPEERAERERQLDNWLTLLFQVEDDTVFWKVQGKIAFAHVRRHVRNEYMVSIACRIQEFMMAKVLEVVPPQDALKILTSFNRILSTVIGITVALYDMVIAEATGASPDLIDNLIEGSIDEIREELGV